MSASSRLARSIFVCLLVFADSSVGDTRPLSGAPSATMANKIVVQNFYYALPGKADEVYLWRLHASEVRAHLGLAVGRVLRKMPASGNKKEGAELPDVIWECDYPSARERAADIAKLDGSKEFDEVEAHMQTLIRKLRRAIFETSTDK
jgi:hypothetical protein